MFNKDPKDPNKYEIEGQKVLQTTNQLQDYYMKMIQDHINYIGYLEDCFGDNDFEGHRNFKKNLNKKYPHI